MSDKYCPIPECNWCHKKIKSDLHFCPGCERGREEALNEKPPSLTSLIWIRESGGSDEWWRKMHRRWELLPDWVKRIDQLANFFCATIKWCKMPQFPPGTVAYLDYQASLNKAD